MTWRSQNDFLRILCMLEYNSTTMLLWSDIVSTLIQLDIHCISKVNLSGHLDLVLMGYKAGDNSINF